MKKNLFLVLAILILSGCVGLEDLTKSAGPPMRPVPKQVTAAEITAGTESKLRSYAPDDIVSFISTHEGADAFTVKVDAAATAAYLYNAGSGAVRAGTNVTIDDDGDYITINASLAGGAVDTSGTLNSDEIAVMHDLDTIKSLTEAEFKTAYNMEAGVDYLAYSAVSAGTDNQVTRYNGTNAIQGSGVYITDTDDIGIGVSSTSGSLEVNNDGTEDSLVFSGTASGQDRMFRLLESTEAGTGWQGMYIEYNSTTNTLDIGRHNSADTTPGNDSISLSFSRDSSTVTASGTVAADTVTLDTLLSIGSDPADAGAIRLDNATAIAWEDATETTLTHVDNTGLSINTGLAIGGTLDANGVVALGDGGDNFSVASDGIDIDTSGNVTNAGTIGCGKVTSSAAFESATGLFDVTGAAAITVGSADVTVITLQTDDTGDGTDLVLPAQSVNGSEMLNNTVTATQLGATLTFADGDVVDLSGITHTGSTDEGLALPTWANVTPTSDKAWAAWDGTNQILKIYDGGWVSISPSGAPTDAQYLTLALDATLSDERVLTAGYALDFTDGGAGSTLTVALDTTEVSADGSDTWSDGSNASIVWTFDVSGTDHTMTAGSGLMTFGDAVTVTDTLTANNGIDLGTSNSISGTTAMTFGAGTETIAINSSDWDIDATGIMTGIGAITSDGVITATGFTIGSAAITETELEILDGATLSTTQINYLASATGTTGTTNTNVVFSASPTFTGTVVAAGIDGSGTFSANLFTPDAADGADIGSTTLEFSDIYVADGSIIYFGADQDVTLTHVADTGLNLNEAFSIADDKALTFGGSLAGYDWTIIYDETTSDALEFTHTAGAGADVTFDLNDDAADSTYTVTNSDGTFEANLDVEGDITSGGAITSSSSGDSYLELSNNASIAPSGNRLYFEGNETKVSENGSEETVLTDADGATLTGTSWDFGGVTNFEIPNGNSATADAEGEIAIDTDDDQFQMYVGGTAIVMDFTADAVGYVLKSDGAGNLTMQADATGGTPTWNSVSDPTGDTTIDHDAGEETNFTFTGNYTTGSQFLIQQATGNPTGGVLFEVQGADSDSTVMEVGDGTNVWTVSTVGLLTNAGTATLNLAAASDLTVGGSQIDHDDMAGAAVVATTGGINCDEDVDIDFDAADEELSIVNSAEYGADGAQVTIENTDADVGAAMYLLRLRYTDDGQANADFAVFEDNNGDDMITFTDGGAITAVGAVTGGTVTDGAVTLAGDGTITGLSAGGLPDDSVIPDDMASGVYDLGTSLEADTLTEGGVGVPNTGDNLSVFAATTSAQLYGVLSDETGSGAGSPLAVFNQNPTIDDITIGSAGVKLSDDGDGALTISGLGDGSDEDLTLNFDDVANEIGVTSSTSVDNINFGAIRLETTGDITGGTLTTSKSAAYTIGTDDTRESYGGIVYVTSAATITLPAIADGMAVTVITIGATAVSVDTNASDLMYLDGTALDDGDKATNTSTTGDMLVCTYYSADGWYCASGSPDGDHWTDGGP